MFRSALVPLDDSDSSDFALRQAILFSQRCQFQLTGLGIVDVPEITKTQISPPGANGFKKGRDEALLRDANARISQVLDCFQAECAQSGVPCKAHIVGGAPYQEVLYEAELHDLIFMGRDTNFHFETQESAGETFGQLAQDSPRPILVAPRKGVPEEDCVLVCYDGSNQSARSLHLFALLLLEFLPKVTVVTIGKTKAKAERRCQQARAFLSLRGADVTAYPLESSADPAEIIQAQMEILKPICTVIGSYGRAGLSRLFFGSTTRDLLNDCDRSLFLYH